MFEKGMSVGGPKILNLKTLIWKSQVFTKYLQKKHIFVKKPGFFRAKENCAKIWLVVSTHLKSISQIGLFPQVGMKIKDI